MFLVRKIYMNTKNYLKIKELIKNTDAILIGAVAGLSSSAGIDYSSTSFKINFPELVNAYGMTDMYTSSFYEFDTEEERWSYGKNILIILLLLHQHLKYIKIYLI